MFRHGIIFLLWLVASFIGEMLTTICFSVVFLAALIGVSDDPDWLTAISFTAVGGAIAGVFIGVAQWIAIDLALQLVLKRRFRSACWWLIANVFSFALIGAAMIAMWINLARFPALNLPIHRLFLIPIGGATLGVGQWLVLRKYLVKAAWWIGATMVGLSFWWGLAVRILWTQRSTELIFIVFGALIYSMITGIVLVWLLGLTKNARLINE